MNSVKWLRFLVVFGVAAVVAMPSQARESSIHFPRPGFMPTGQYIDPPYGFIGFCQRDEQDCEGGTDKPSHVVLTPSLWADLNAVHALVNREPQVTDLDNYHVNEYWTYPGPRGGDCEDLALEKRRLLIEHGWPVDALLIATVRQPNGDGHAVLLVETDRGEFVLDNTLPRIVSWRDVPYTWRARQSRERPYIWVDLDRKTFRTVVATKLPPIGAPIPFLQVAQKPSTPAVASATPAH